MSEGSPPTRVSRVVDVDPEPLFEPQVLSLPHGLSDPNSFLSLRSSQTRCHGSFLGDPTPSR